MDQTETTANGGTPVPTLPIDDHLAGMEQAARAVGLDLERTVLVVLACAVCFFVGVAVRCINCQGRGLRPSRLVAISVPTFFLTSPLQAKILVTNWGHSTLTPFDWLAGALRDGGSVQIVMFAFGLIMMMGYLVEPIFTRVTTLLENKLQGSTAPS